MIDPPRAWLRTFADPAVLSDLLAAARSCMADVDDCDPDECDHPEQLVTPLELAQWIEREVHRAGFTGRSSLARVHMRQAHTDRGLLRSVASG